MSFQTLSCEDQYQKFPQLKRSDVLGLLEWKKTQPHLPDITGDDPNKKCFINVYFSEIIKIEFYHI